MNDSLKIAVTGGIGSGKSTVTEIIGRFGYKTVSADEIARGLTKRDDVLEKISAEFSGCVIDGILNRRALAEAVFADENKLKILNSILHPLVMDEILKTDGKVVFAEVPLLFEGKYEKLFSRVIVVMRPREARISAAMARSGMTRAEVEARIARQTDYENGDFSKYLIIENDGDKNALERKTLALVNSLGLSE